MMNQRYRVVVKPSSISVVDTKLFTANNPNGVTVLYIGCGTDHYKRAANLQRVIAEYSVAPQNIKFL